ncbi:YdeI/OmpD-associated family protein [Dyadobacter sp. CY356]|uniref:YdeI/OmpD-associated family protein n=1 Tax=Dyadobacter sp. CY356 TaxID=2906442 RepID=UPI00286D994F|nr:YdeI/OmpD-associated family protein [Dyadobacter sp. CY356]
MIYHKKSAQVPTLTWSEAVDEALCFGWIDSISKPLDSERFMQFFSKRKPKSGWSKINKDKVEKLIEAGLMTEAGFAVIEAAKQNGSWFLLDEVEKIVIPADLQQAIAGNPIAYDFFQTLSRTDKRNLLQWLILAKKNETRQKRIYEIIEFASQKLKPSVLKWTKKPEP